MQINSIRLMISQPLTSKNPSFWEFKADESVSRSQEVLRECADKALGLIGQPLEVIEQHLTPGEEQCAYCRAKSSCKALAAVVKSAVAETSPSLEGFDDLADKIGAGESESDKAALAKHYLALPLIKKWVEAVEKAVQGATLAGEMGADVGLKVVIGQEGSRAWDNPEAVEELMRAKKFKEDDMYSKKLISPTQAEAKLKELKPRVWKEIEAHIYRAPGKPTVVSISDKRPAVDVKPTSSGFEDVSNDDLV